MKRGFTLVELSIVLVIIGLLIGGLLVARSMIETAQVQGTLKRVSEYEIAINNFRTNYKLLPGDAPLFTPAGNGDGALSWGGGGTFATCNGMYENMEYIQFFGHLVQAGLLKADLQAFAPHFCPGGSRPVTGDSSYSDIAYPTIQLDSKAADALNYGKANITPVKTAASNLRLRFYVNAPWVIPIVNKIGHVPNANASVGVTNMLFSEHNCYDPDINLVNCANNGAYGDLMFHLAPI